MSRAEYMAEYRARKASGNFQDKRMTKHLLDDVLCLHCKKNLGKPKRENNPQKFCDNVCQTDYQRNLAIEHGIAGHSATRTFLKKKYDNKCQQCSTGEWQGKSLNLHLHHIDGDAYNNDLSNVMLLCPNCHSQTENYGVYNKGQGRSTRKKKPTPFYPRYLDQSLPLDIEQGL